MNDQFAAAMASLAAASGTGVQFNMKQEASERVLQMSLQMNHDFLLKFIAQQQAGRDAAPADNKVILERLDRLEQNILERHERHERLEQKLDTVITLLTTGKENPPTTPTTTPRSQKITPVDQPDFWQEFSEGAPFFPLRDPSTPVTKPAGVAEKQDVSGASTFEESQHGEDSNAENEPGDNLNFELAEPDGDCRGILKNGSSNRNGKPMKGKRLFMSPSAQNEQV